VATVMPRFFTWLLCCLGPVGGITAKLDLAASSLRATFARQHRSVNRSPRRNFTLRFEDAEPLFVTAPTAFKMHMSTAGVAEDSSRGSWLHPKNGTPWYRYQETSSAGYAGHQHFGGLASGGSVSDDFLRAHNIVRANAGLPSVQWNAELQHIAEARLAKLSTGGCYIQHSASGDRLDKAGFEYLGENLYKVLGMKPTGVDVVDAWYAEIQDYTYGYVGDTCVKSKCEGRSRPPCTLGHFTQVMWRESTDIGCALRQCNEASTEADIAYLSLCMYGPGGNIVGELPFSGSAAYHVGLELTTCDQQHRSRRRRQHQEPRSDLSSSSQPSTEHNGADAVKASFLLPVVAVLWLLRV